MTTPKKLNQPRNGIHIREDFTGKIHKLPLEDIGIIYNRLYEMKKGIIAGKGMSSEMSKEGELIYKAMTK
jgi:hypothetical protein